MGNQRFILKVMVKVIVNPFISGNDKCDLDEQTLDVDYIILTHGHADHFGDVVELANRNHATVIGSAELQGYLSTYHGVEDVHGMNIGGKANLISVALNMFKLSIVQVSHEDGIPVYRNANGTYTRS